MSIYPVNAKPASFWLVLIFLPSRKSKAFDLDTFQPLLFKLYRVININTNMAVLEALTFRGELLVLKLIWAALLGTLMAWGKVVESNG